MKTLTLLLLLSAAMAARADEPAKPGAEKDAGFKAEELVGAWKLVSGEKGGKPMAKDATGGIFVFAKDTLVGKSRYGDELSGMSYTLDTTKKPVVMKLTVTKNFPGAKADAIVELRDGKLFLCYGKEPTSFVTKEGENNRSMVFVKSVDPAVAQGEIKAASEKKWSALRDQDAAKFIELARLKFSRTGPTGMTKDAGGTFPDYTNPKNKLDAVAVVEQQITVFGDMAVETGRATGSKKDQKAPAFDVRYTHTWVKDDGKWMLVSDHQSAAE